MRRVLQKIFLVKVLQSNFSMYKSLVEEKKRFYGDGLFVPKYYLCCGFAIKNETLQI